MIEVTYESLPILSDPIRGDAGGCSDFPSGSRLLNVFCHYQIRKGDLEGGFAQADVIIEGEYRTPAQEHAYLQPEAGISFIDEEGRITVKVGGQWTHEDAGANRPCFKSAA